MLVGRLSSDQRRSFGETEYVHVSATHASSVKLSLLASKNYKTRVWLEFC